MFAYSREFAHRIKSISMSKFTDIEVKNMIKFGGNEVSKRLYKDHQSYSMLTPCILIYRQHRNTGELVMM
jgi:hypothetical protein